MSSAAGVSAEDENSQTVAERNASYGKHSNAISSKISATDSTDDQRHPEIITKSNITVALNGNTEQKQFYMQDLMIVDGDCLFSTLLGILKVARLTELQQKLNEAHYESIKVEDSNEQNIVQYNQRNNPRELEAYKLRHILVDYTAQEVEPNTSYSLIIKDVGTTDVKLKKTEDNMRYLHEYGTDNEIAAATLLFKINIYVVHSQGISSDQLYKHKGENDNQIYYIYNQAGSHYRNLWEVSPPHGDNFTQASELPDTAGKAVKPISELIAESGSSATVSSAATAVAAATAATVASSPVPSPERLTGGVVQVFEGDGKYHSTDDEKIFAPILKVIDGLIREGYQHIGLTYSANQDQTIKIFEKYGYDKSGSSISNLSKSINNTELIGNDEWWPSGSGQAQVLESLKTKLNEANYQSKFRIIPFSTMRHHSKGKDTTRQNRTDPDPKLHGSIKECINFANLFLKQKNSIILGWCGHSLPKIQSNLSIQEFLNDKSKSDKSIYFSIGSTNVKFGMWDKTQNHYTPNTAVTNGQDLMNKYAQWALTRWDETSQKIVDEISDSPSAAPGTVTASKTQVPPTLVYPPKDIIPIIKTRINEIVNHTTDTTGIGVGRGQKSPPIAILVNGGSFNPIHNGHLEMYIRAREELMTKQYTDVLIIYCVSAFSDLQKKHASAPAPVLLFDESGKKNRINLCREAFACIDDVNEPGKIQFAADGRHLSTNMFVWPEEDSSPYKNQIILSLHGVTGLNVTLFGLAGQDKVATPDYYFLNGIKGNSIIVGRGGEGGSIDATIFAAPTGGFPEDTGNSYDPTTGKIAIQSGLTIASSRIQPEILKLRDLTSKWAQHFGKNMFISDCSNGNCISFNDQDDIIEKFQKKMNSPPLSQVPKCILYQLLTYGLPRKSEGKEDPDELRGYKQFRRFLFGKLINSHIDTNTGKLTTNTVPANVSQEQHNVIDILSGLSAIKSSASPKIEFLQMTTGRALYIETKRNQSPPPPKVCILNFANANTVGGGVMRGQTVQEETLCMMAPDLYLSLRAVADNGAEDTTTGQKIYGKWGESNWDSQFYYTKKEGPISFKTKDEFAFKELETSDTGAGVTVGTAASPYYTGHVITAAAPNLKTGSGKSTIDFNTPAFENQMIKIIQNIAYVASSIQDCDVLILGAWGCGAFAPKGDDNKPYIQKVAQLFYKALHENVPGVSSVTFKDLFDKIIFPIPDCYTYDIFKTGFNDTLQRPPPPSPPPPIMRPILSKAAGAAVAVAAGVAAGVTSAAIVSSKSEQPITSLLKAKVTSPPRSPSHPPSPPLSSATSVPATDAPDIKPYITLTHLIAKIDSSIDYFVEQIATRNPLKEISVNDQSSTAPDNKLKFARVDGNFPTIPVPLFEQMVYHRAGSTNLNPLSLFIPTGYKINFQEIVEYFREMLRRKDQETQELVDFVIAAYGNHYNSLFYHHTLPGKQVKTGTGAGAVTGVGTGVGRPMTGGAPPIVKSVFDMDPKTAEFIQFKIDKWHRSYIDWRFYQNATRFFIENRELSRGELIALKIEFDEVFGSGSGGSGSGGSGLMKMVNSISGIHEKIKEEYNNLSDYLQNGCLKKVVSPYIKFFKVIYKNIEDHLNDKLTDFISDRRTNFGFQYKFDDNIKNSLFKLYTEISVILDTINDDDIGNIAYLKLMPLLQVFTTQIDELNRKFPPDLKKLFNELIVENDKNESRTYYKTYTLLQYIYWLFNDSESDGYKNPFVDNLDKKSPSYVSSESGVDESHNYYPDNMESFNKYDHSKNETRTPAVSKDTSSRISPAPHHDDFLIVNYVENEKNHVRRLIEIFKKDADKDIAKFVQDYIEGQFDLHIKSYKDINRSTIPLPFGIDLLLCVLNFTTNKVISYIQKIKEQTVIDLTAITKLQEDIKFKQGKLHHMFDLISKLTGIPVERIIPDRVKYYHSNSSPQQGLVDPAKYTAEWSDILTPTPGKSTVSDKIKFVTDKMTRGLDKSLGLDPTDPTNEDNTKKKKAALVELLEHNTIQVVHMLFAKPRDIWYSPDMRNVSLTSVSKWSFFRLEKPEIVTKSAFNLLKTTKWDAEIGTSRRLDYILDKSLKIPLGPGDTVYDIDMVSPDSFQNNSLVNDEKPLCALIVASQPSPQMLDPSKDSANESRFQLTSFNAALGSPSAFGFEGDGTGAGAGEPAVNDDHNVGAKLMDKLTGLIKPNPEKCSNVRNLLQEQANEISSMTADIVKSAGVDLSIKAKKLMEDINTKKYMDMIKASLAEAEKAAKAADAAVEGLDKIAAAAATNFGSGSSPIEFTDVKTAADKAKKAAAAAKTKADEAKKADDAKTAQPNQLEKTADEVKALEIEAIKQSAIAVSESKKVKKLAFDQVSDGIAVWNNAAKDKLNDKKDMTTLKGVLSTFLTNMQIPPYSSSDTIQNYIAHIKTQIKEWDDFTKEIDETYGSLNDKQLLKIAIESLNADSPAAEFTTTVATAKEAFDKINNDIDDAVKKVIDKAKEIGKFTKEMPGKVDEDTAAIAATVSAAITANLGPYLQSENPAIQSAANNIVTTATAVTAAATKSKFKDKLDQLLNVENKAAAITAAISAIPLLDKAQQYQGHSVAVLAAVTTAVTAAVTDAVTDAVSAAQEASTKTTPADTLQSKQKAEAALKKAQAAAAVVASVVAGGAGAAPAPAAPPPPAPAAPAPAAPPPPAPAPVLGTKIDPYDEANLLRDITASLAKLP